MNKRELIKVIHAESGAPQSQIEGLLNRVLDLVVAELMDGGEVSIQGFGKFFVKRRAARKGRNPRTGKTLDIPAGRRAAFNPGKKLKQAFKEV